MHENHATIYKYTIINDGIPFFFIENPTVTSNETDETKAPKISSSGAKNAKAIASNEAAASRSETNLGQWLNVSDKESQTFAEPLNL
jgi:hypothetical protein